MRGEVGGEGVGRCEGVGVRGVRSGVRGGGEREWNAG